MISDLTTIAAIAAAAVAHFVLFSGAESPRDSYLSLLWLLCLAAPSVLLVAFAVVRLIQFAGKQFVSSLLARATNKVPANKKVYFTVSNFISCSRWWTGRGR
jgi:hypothetical protein